jgi:hypothetical protein
MSGETMITVIGNITTKNAPAVISAQGLTDCIIEDCGKPIVGRGRCRRHYAQWHAATPPTERQPAFWLKCLTPRERFDLKVDRRGPDECWPWKPPCHRSGHGEFYVSPERGKVPAHTFAVELATGEQCPPGKEGCHRCDNPPCCNPAHVYYGTRQQNVDDMHRRSRASIGSAHPNSKLTEEAVVRLRQQVAAGIPIADLAWHYGVSAAAVSHAASGLTWKHAGGPITKRPVGRPNRKDITT